MESPTLAHSTSEKPARPRFVALLVLGFLVVVFVAVSLATDAFGHHYRLYRARRLCDDLREQFRADPRFAHVGAGGSTNGEVIVAGNLASDADARALIRFANSRRGSVTVSYGCAIAGDANRFYCLLGQELEPLAPTATAAE